MESYNFPAVPGYLPPPPGRGFPAQEHLQRSHLQDPRLSRSQPRDPRMQVTSSMAPPLHLRDMPRLPAPPSPVAMGTAAMGMMPPPYLVRSPTFSQPPTVSPHQQPHPHFWRPHPLSVPPQQQFYSPRSQQPPPGAVHPQRGVAYFNHGGVAPPYMHNPGGVAPSEPMPMSARPVPTDPFVEDWLRNVANHKPPTKADSQCMKVRII